MITWFQETFPGIKVFPLGVLWRIMISVTFVQESVTVNVFQNVLKW